MRSPGRSTSSGRKGCQLKGRTCLSGWSGDPIRERTDIISRDHNSRNCTPDSGSPAGPAAGLGFYGYFLRFIEATHIPKSQCCSLHIFKFNRLHRSLPTEVSDFFHLLETSLFITSKLRCLSPGRPTSTRNKFVFRKLIREIITERSNTWARQHRLPGSLSQHCLWSSSPAWGFPVRTDRSNGSISGTIHHLPQAQQVTGGS